MKQRISLSQTLANTIDPKNSYNDYGITTERLSVGKSRKTTVNTEYGQDMYNSDIIGSRGANREIMYNQ